MHIQRATLLRRLPFLAIFPQQGHKSTRIAPQEARRPRHRLEEENNFAGARTGRTPQPSATNDDEFFSAGHTLARAARVREREASTTTHRRWLETIGQVRDANKEIGICMGKAASERQRWKMAKREEKSVARNYNKGSIVGRFFPLFQAGRVSCIRETSRNRRAEGRSSAIPRTVFSSSFASESRLLLSAWSFCQRATESHNRP